MINYENNTLQEDMSMEKKLLRIIDRKQYVLCNKMIPLIQIKWQYHGIKECMLEPGYEK